MIAAVNNHQDVLEEVRHQEDWFKRVWTAAAIGATDGWSNPAFMRRSEDMLPAWVAPTESTEQNWWDLDYLWKGNHWRQFLVTRLDQSIIEYVMTHAIYSETSSYIHTIE